jgi:GMP synthase-like glutamine amidotransferase
MHLAILDADILKESLRPTYHSYGRMFEALFERQQPRWDMTIFKVIDREYPESMEQFDGYLITGSQYDAFSDESWIRELREYVRALYEAEKPMVGICFGHQLLAHALGGEAARSDAGWGMWVMTYPLCSKPPFVDDANPVSLLVSHRDQVARLPPGAELLLSNDFCPNAAFYIPNRVLAIQGHPEFSVDYAQALFEKRKHELTPDHAAEIAQSFLLPHQGERIGMWIRRFLEQAVG